eukprot:CAMPEP_0172931258 /NCGR_PEP_ID=MMETSP1075-20121228/219406_1 /TAXON_ID=2916 /ORGANISM="Ceratium fusus, Strain PA161109" /LENGTH=309 /DNA_ID=CAMNT_0013792577 /DNA_START=63 /DNA_END=992 /DNA_ORIENTATION=-
MTEIADGPGQKEGSDVPDAKRRREDNYAAALPSSVNTVKAYKNSEFLGSGAARLIRVMCEFEETGARLDAQGVENVVMFFGSARAKPKAEYEAALRAAEAAVEAAPVDSRAAVALRRLQKQAFLIPMFDAVRELAKKLTLWSAERVAMGKPPFYVGTGGGPGMMAAANHGAALAGGKSLGLGISLPFEDGLNPWVTPSLGFEFHYFFTRKFWMSYKMMALVIAPGGLGTCDELFEIITLMQTGKIGRKLPIILIGKKFWNDCIKWEAFVEYGMISEEDASQLIFADSADEAFPQLIAGLERIEAASSAQ